MESIDPDFAPDNEDNEDTNEYKGPDYFNALNVRQRLFVEEFVKCGNATKAAKKAGYSTNLASAATIGYRLLRNVEISKAIEQYLDDRTLKTNQILFKLSQKAEASIEPFVESYGRGMMFDFSSKKARAAFHTIKKYKTGKYGAEIEFHDPIRAMVAIEQIRHRAFDKKIVPPANSPITDDVSQLTDDELQREIEELARRTAS
ncbi:terminase small subunit [Spirosoma sp. 48-14]|uniref:terminase small subunit n=1 Tax=Spirosoma sp. 48-14 TaxID=1895854 RepID=UPI0009679285|nr:terminase small subunit [Spirosoma sp. 48-14]OJW78429.1 MAG: hypothetical protein BGO59_30985 [Spirosoma sp. 48-14]